MRVEYISCVGCTQTLSYKYRLQSSSTNENIFLTKTTRTHRYVLYMCIRRSMAAITVNRLPFTICRAQIKAKWIRINKLCKCRNWVSRHPTPDTRERRREYALGTLGTLRTSRGVRGAHSTSRWPFFRFATCRRLRPFRRLFIRSRSSSRYIFASRLVWFRLVLLSRKCFQHWLYL